VSRKRGGPPRRNGLMGRDRDDGPLFPGRPPYNGFPPFEKGSDTSLRAAASVAHAAQSKCEQVFSVIRASADRGMTDEEIERALGMKHQSASARRRTLVLEDRVHDSGLERRNQTGRNANVWKVGPRPSIGGGSGDQPSSPQVARS
jgi:hypothetical protein